MVTIRDVAARAGVSVATTSRALSGRGSVDPYTKQLVQSAAAELNYSVNRNASGLRSWRTHKIGLIVSSLQNPYYSGIVKGAQSRARELGYTVLTMDSGADAARERRQVEELSGWCDGVEIATSALREAELESRAAQAPIVLLQREHPGLPSVMTDIAAGFGQLLDHLLALGHERFSYVGPQQSDADAGWMARHRHQVITQLTGERGIDLIDIGSVSYDFEGGIAASERLLGHHITAAVCGDDSVGLGVLQGLRAQGIKVPEQISVSGFDDLFASQLSAPPLTTVRSELYASARTAIELAVSIIRDAAASQQTLISHPQLLVRASTARASGSSVLAVGGAGTRIRRKGGNDG